MKIEYSDKERALDHLAGCVIHIRALPDLIEKYRDEPRNYQALIESYLVNYRLLFEFFDNSLNKKDFDAKTFLPNWTYEFPDDARNICDFASRHVIHFSLERLIPEVVEKEFPTDSESLKMLNNLLEIPLKQFMNELPERSTELGA